jgi:hypothetical protein
MFLNNLRTKFNLITFNKFFPSVSKITGKNFVTFNHFNTNIQQEYLNSQQMAVAPISNDRLDILDHDDSFQNKISHIIPTAEFLNKTSKLAFRKRMKRKYGKKTSLRYR